jgi:hypothetical protein
MSIPNINYQFWMDQNPFYGNIPIPATMRTGLVHYASRPGLIDDIILKIDKLLCAELVREIQNGIENVAYFLPVDESDQTLTFILGYPSEDSRDEFWNKFANDPVNKQAILSFLKNKWVDKKDLQIIIDESHKRHLKLEELGI